MQSKERLLIANTPKVVGYRLVFFAVSEVLGLWPLGLVEILFCLPFGPNQNGSTVGYITIVYTSSQVLNILGDVINILPSYQIRRSLSPSLVGRIR